MFRRLMFLSCAIFLSSCATVPQTYYITYKSHPTGATIISANRVFGRAPLQLSYLNPGGSDMYATLPGTQDLRLYRSHNDVICQWPSGAKVRVPVTVDLKTGSYFETSCIRPKDHPGLEKDLAISDKLNAEQRANAAVLAQQQMLARQAREAEELQALSILSQSAPMIGCLAGGGGNCSNVRNTQVRNMPNAYKQKQTYVAPTPLQNTPRTSTAFFTGNYQTTTSATGMRALNCEYGYAASTMWQLFTNINTCPISIKIQ